MFVHTFNTPKNHPKSKPFIDHVLSFNYIDGKIHFRAHQIVNQYEAKFTEEDDVDKLILIEIGPRMTLNLVKILDGSLCGEGLY
jgi:ribosome biogenesis protein BRX1